MTTRFIYDENYILTIPAVVIDNRINIPEISGAVGSVIKNYTDSQVQQVVPGVIPYKLENEIGALVGYMLVKTDNIGKNATILDLVLRAGFQELAIEISNDADFFINSGDWMFDVL